MTQPKPYAAGTDVPVARSKTELNAFLEKIGATKVLLGTDTGTGVDIIAFEVKGRPVKLEVHAPQPGEVLKTPAGKRRTGEQLDHAMEAETRRRWRALILMLKGKWEAIQSGIVSFEAEFLPYTMLPNRQTVAEYLEPQVKDILDHKKMPPMLPWGNHE
jgi:hypothetical protein